MKSLIRQLNVGPPTTFRGLSMFPLEAFAGSTLDYMLLGDALREDLVTVREVSREGSVPDLEAENRARRPVLIVDGEELVGAKQNRVANLSILLPAGKTVRIPVSCVEEGRWDDVSPQFEESDQLLFSRARMYKLESVSESLRSDDDRRSDQSQLWDSIDWKARRMEAASSSGAMREIFDTHGESLEEFVAAYEASPRQTGAVFAIGAEVCGIDLFDKPQTFRALLPKLIRSYAIDAMEHPHHDAHAPSVACAQAMIERLGDGELSEHDAVGLGKDLRISGDGTVGAALIVEAQTLHLAAFAMDDDGGHVERGRSFLRR